MFIPNPNPNPTPNPNPNHNPYPSPTYKDMCSQLHEVNPNPDPTLALIIALPAVPAARVGDGRHQRRGAVSRRAESDVAAVRHDHRGQRVDGRGG